jgi:hypothetical protein
MRFRGQVFKWLWIPSGTLDLTLSFPASLTDLSQWLFRTSSSLSCPQLLRPPTSMDRNRGDPRAGSKWSFDEYDLEEGRRLEVRLRERIEQGDLRR